MITIRKSVDPVYLYNTLSHSKEVFTPLRDDRVTMYVCGPTVYSFAHIGNARPAVVFDVLARVLRRRFGELRYVRNITDIDDKIYAAAAESGVPITEIASRFTTAYHEDLASLGTGLPDVEPRATEHIAPIVAMIEVLIGKGHAYVAEGHVLFDVASYSGYGELSRRDPEEMLAGARVEVAPYKRDPGDFVLWKPSTADLPGWESPWGRGRPGWHIECSVMAAEHLGETIDIHGGGSDLVFPHHENERAQSTCAHEGRTFARFWLHNGFVNVDREKMSKSIGNVLLVRDLLHQAPGEAIRLALISAHYRAPLEWNDETLRQARNRLDGLYQTLRDMESIEADHAAVLPEQFITALEDDLNTPRALAELSGLCRLANSTADEKVRSRIKGQLLGCGGLLGLLQQDPEHWFATGAGELDTTLVEALIEERADARRARDFSRADAVRDRLAAMGVAIEDGAGGTRWRRI